MVNWWLIAVIVVAAIAAIIGLIYLFYYAFSLFKDFEEKDSDYMGMYKDYLSDNDNNDDSYVSNGRSIYIFSLLLGVTAGLYNIVQFLSSSWTHFWKNTAVVNIFFILVLIGLMLFNFMQANIVYKDVRKVKRKTSLGIFYSLFGCFVGILGSILVVIALVWTVAQDWVEDDRKHRYKLDDGTVVDAERGIFGRETGEFKERYGSSRYKRTGWGNEVEEINE